MEFTYDPFPLILNRGRGRGRGDEDTVLACLSFFGLEDSPRAKECLLALIKRQRSDGGFPSELDSHRWGMRETVRTALLLLEVGLPPQGVNVDGAVQFALRHQKGDGGWCENPALELPPARTWLSCQRGIT